MDAARPITSDEYKAFREELYKTRQDASREVVAYHVDLDSDPTMQPKNISAKLARVQSFKERMVVILNRAILAEAFWKTAVGKIEAKFKAELSRALASEEIRKAGGSADSREAMASVAAERSVVAEIFNGQGKLEDHMLSARSRLADASAFHSEVQNLFDNLDSAETSLAVQQKNTVLSLRLQSFHEQSEVLAVEA
jgi:hypothetical protein